MMVGSEFAGDSNETLKMIQHDLYGALSGYLYHYARERYLKAIGLVGVETELSRILEEKEPIRYSPQGRGFWDFDHRVLQDAHDHIAAYFRFAHDDRGQRALLFEGQKDEEVLSQKWSEFFHKESRELAEIEATNLAILGAVAFQNTEQGYRCEKQLREALRQRYGELHAPRWA